MTSTAPSARFGHCLDGRVDEHGPIENCLRFDAGRKSLVDFAHLRVDCGGDRAAIGPNQHERRADDNFLTVQAGAACAQLTAHAHLRDVADANGNAIPRRNHNLFQVVHRLDAAAARTTCPSPLRSM